MKDDVEVKSCTFNGLVTDKNFKYELDNVLEILCNKQKSYQIIQ